MTAITIRLADDRVQKLKALAAASGVSPEDFLSQSIEIWLEQSKTDFSQAAAYVLQKNAELYKRLAK